MRSLATWHSRDPRRQICEFRRFGPTLLRVTADFVARLGSRASVPEEVHSSWGVAEYVGLMAREDGIDEELHQLAYGAARSLRRLDPARLLALIGAMARPPSAELNKAGLAATAGIPATTISPYIDIVERIGVVRMLPGTQASVAKRVVGRPRVLFADPAVARHLSGVTADHLAELEGRGRLAPLLTGVAIVELLRQRETSAVEYRLGHLRERNGLEVDLIVELPDDTVYGIEVRTAAGFRPHQFRALGALAARAGSRFRGGIVLNTATVGFKYRPGMWGLPISALWEWDARDRGLL
jgi:predicted AAA+ superfamily ATPase